MAIDGLNPGFVKTLMQVVMLSLLGGKLFSEIWLKRKGKKKGIEDVRKRHYIPKCCATNCAVSEKIFGARSVRREAILACPGE